MKAPWQRGQSRPPAVPAGPAGPPAAKFAAFQPPAIEILTAPTPVRYRATLYLLLAFLVCALAFACLAKVDRIVAAPGKLVAAGKNIAVAPLEAGTIRDIRVTAGQRVAKDEILATLDPTLAEAGLAERDKERRALAAKVWRLSCETSGQCAPPPDLDAEDLRLERDLLAARRQELAAKRDALTQTARELSAKLATNATESTKNKKQIGLARDLERMHGDVYNQGASSKVEYMKAQSQRIEAEGQLAKLGNEAAELRESLAKAEAEKRDFQSNWNAQAARDLAEASRALAGADDPRRKAAHLRDQVALRAPEAGTVLDVAAKAAGAVVGAGETLLTIVPGSDTLVVEADVAAQDIGLVRPGDTVRVKFEAFPFQRHGTGQGVVATISPDALEKQTPEGQRLFYRARATITDVGLTGVPPDFHRFPGLTVTAEIKVGQRRVITYLTYPLVRAFDESLREP
ncbi:HlyD family type I secretion periplasmic adaptor subunit [Solidesulfovibrio sp.]|uniref:HlyD family type I secretion periplasmic adaptor subunit n=1 Tax=Solidesulfovibrio sp. TaxID=2910990 RepID=UPI002B20D0DD|nr:HlyD family type I secretion periplasmic adaptor subunit [Solidesulfovibrio sp.]MEA4856939.1 HlyD family type I secretion periplasmic adaptor subunit [Solidesulfovibrio sp.]